MIYFGGIMKELDSVVIKSICGLNTFLVDKRHDHWGCVFGMVKDVAKNYGIKCSQKDEYVIFEAPKSRLQIFCGILHFSGLNYEVVNGNGEK